MFRRGRSPRSKLAWAQGFGYVCPNVSATWNSGSGCDDLHVVTAWWYTVPAGGFDSRLGSFQPDDLTLLRTLVGYASSVRIAGASNDSLITHGFGLVRWDGRDETPPSILDVPFPTTEGNFDWIVRIAQPDCFTASAAVANVYAEFFPRVTRDAESKAKRKLSTGAGLLAVADTWLQHYTAGGIQTASVQQSWNIRTLFKLP